MFNSTRENKMEATTCHWYATSFVYWRVAETKEKLIELMDKLDHMGCL